MKLSRERKVYLAILSIGGCVLGADQFMGGPAAANASTSPAGTGASEKDAGQAEGRSGTPGITRVALHERLSSMASAIDEQSAALAFSIDPAWRLELTPAESAKSESGQETSAPTPGNARLPKVSMVVLDASGGFAVMDGKPVRVGEVSDQGVTLLRVAKGAVTVGIDGVEHTITVADGNTPGVR